MKLPRLPRIRRPRTTSTSTPTFSEGRGGPLGALTRAIRTVGYTVQDLLRLGARAIRGAGRGVRGFWFGLDVRARRRLVLGLAAGAAAALALAFAVPRLPCQFPGGDVCPPADDAAGVVPADTLAYAHLSLEEGGDQERALRSLLAGLPQISRELLGPLLARVPGPGGEPADFERDLAPWLGEEAAIAILPVSGAGEQVVLLEEGDAEAATEYAESIASGEGTTAEAEGIEITTDPRGLATASVDGFLAIGTEEAVRRVAEASAGAGGARPLSDDVVAEDLLDELPPDRFAEVYLGPEGIEALVANPSGPLATAEPFIDGATSTGAAVSLGASEDALEVAIRSSLDPERADADPGFFAAFPPFEPELPDRLAEDALAYTGIADPGTTLTELFAQATAEAPALAEGLSAAIKRLRDAGNVNIEKQLLPTLGGEAAFALQPGSRRDREEEEPEETTTAPIPAPEGIPEGPAPEVADEPPVPVLQFVAQEVDTERARRALAQLQGPVSKALDPGATLQAPVFDRREFEGVEMQVLRLSPTVNLTYAIAAGNLAIATQPSGVEQVIEGEGDLAGTDRFEAATEGLSDEPSLLAFLNLGELIKLAEREGLAEDPLYALVAAEVGRLVAAGLSVKAEPTAIATDARLVIDPEPEEEPVVEEEVPAPPE